MKIWTETNIIGTGSGLDMKRPDLPSGVRYSMLDRGDGTCLCRVAGPPEVIGGIRRRLSDGEAEAILKSFNPEFELEDLDVPDPELDDELGTLGEDPDEVRRQVQTPTKGKHVLQDQELAVMRRIAQNRGIAISELDEDEIKEGKTEAHERVLNRLRRVR